MVAGVGRGAHRKGKCNFEDKDNYIIIDGYKIKTYSWDDALNNFGYIYITRNNVNGMLYLGLQYRKQKGYLGSGKHLKNAVSYYGREFFDKYIIDLAEDKDSLEDLEVYYIKYFFGYDIAFSDNWYNITSGRQRGGNSWAGYTEEERENRISKQRSKMLGRHSTEKIRLMLSKVVRKRFEDPDEHEKASIATRKAMNSRENSEKILHGVELPIVVNGKEYWNFSVLARDYDVPAEVPNERYRRGFRGIDLVKYNRDNHNISRWGHLLNKDNRVKEAMTYAKMYKVWVSGVNYTFITGSTTRLAKLVSRYTPVSIGKNNMASVINGKRESYKKIYASVCNYIPDKYRVLYACSYVNGSEGVLLYKEEVNNDSI